jgi:glutamate synthase (NADPH/NADH) small chain
MLKEAAAKLSPQVIEKNFADINPPLTPAQALEEGSRCLFCQDAPCIKACPTEINVPLFIRQIMTENLKGSAKTILEANILGHSCGRVCPTSVLCEGACVLNHEGRRPVAIGRLQRHAVDYVLDNNITLFRAGAENGKKVALIGGGPASLACAAELRRQGFATVIFDAHAESGGLNRYGIAAYKMRAEESAAEVEMIRGLGVEIRNSIEVGRDVALQQLEKDYDAIFLGVGVGETDALGIPGEDLPGVVDAVTFIEETKTLPLSAVKVGGRVAVIGGGNTAIDVVTAAKRLGAEHVYMVYRRSPQEMSAFDYEYDLAKHDAVEFEWNAAPVKAIADSHGHVDTLECIRTQSIGGKLQNVPGSEFCLAVDMVVKALGQKKKVGFLQQIADLTLEKGRVVVNSSTMQTTNPKYFAGGDCVNGGGEVVDAVAHGKRAARGIAAALLGTERGAHA